MGKKNKIKQMAKDSPMLDKQNKVLAKPSKKNKKNPTKDSKDSKKKPSKDSKELANQSLEEFLDNWDNSDMEEEGKEELVGVNVKQDKGEKKKNKIEKGKKRTAGADGDKPPQKKKKSSTAVENQEEEEEGEGVGEGGGEGGSGKEAKAHSKYINTLKDKDPEFYEFLKENDEELLNFNESDSGEEEGDGEDKSDDDEEDEDKVHRLPERLEVASDESDFEDEEVEKATKKSAGKLTVAEVEAWVSEVERQPTARLLGEMVEAFRAAVAAIGAGEETPVPLKYRVEGGTMFNSVVRMCVVNIYPALKSILKQTDEDGHFKPEKTKKWKKVERSVRVYLGELCTLLSRVTEASVATVILKHVHQMIPFFQAYGKGGKQLLGKLTTSWSQGEETVRILAVMCIVKLVRGTPLLEIAVKQMYLAYVKNCKFTSPNTLSHISFMRRSLVEVMGLDHNLAYYQAFVYIRQQAIHLRNALVNNKKDALQAVYNWQFVHSLELWGALLGHTQGSEVMRPLIYPLVQVVIGTAKLVATPKYFPLRFHCCKILSNLSATTGTFIPVLPFYLDILNTFTFNKKSKKVSMKPLDFSCIIKLSKSQLTESGFKDATVEEIYGGMLTYLADNSNKIGFPELVTPLVFQLKEFLKNCKVANYSRKVKQILDKVVANQKFIETRRRPVSFSVGDSQNIQIWEAQVARDGTPLLAFYRNWRKVADTQQMKRHTKQEEKMDDYAHIPLLKKNHKKIRMKKEGEEEVTGGFLSDDGEDSLDEEEMFLPKEERGKGTKESKSRQSDEEGSDSDEEKQKKKKKKGKAVVKPVAEESSGEEEEEDGGEDDNVQDLRLEDLDSGSDLEMEDDFDTKEEEEGEEEDSDDDEEDDDDESD